jgi:hypothetical protein
MLRFATNFFSVVLAKYFSISKLLILNSVMQFTVTIKHERKSIRLVIDKISTSREQEKYKVIARNQSFVLQSNRPFLQMKGLKNFPVTWKVIEGGYNNKYILDQITKAIEWYEK